ncbi:MAG: tail fiber domain-containing protein [Verrucomicrobiota bacterium]
MLVILLALLRPAGAAVPRLLNHQGRVAVNGVNFEGSGQFKFALTDAAATTSYWSNDGTSTHGGEPAAAVSLPVVKGLYAVLLGDSALPNMTPVPVTVFDHDAVLLRVWFNDGAHGFQRLAPDQRIAAVGYALVAEKARQVLLADILAPPVKPVAAWGDNGKGQTTVPTPLADVAAIAGGGSFSLALKTDGTVTAWGDNSAGQLTLPAGLSAVSAIAAGATHGLALKTDGTVAAWGSNGYGQATVPADLTAVTAVAAGLNHSLALKANGTVVAWGDNTFGQLNIPAGLVTVTAIAAGYDHCLALKANGTVIAWGHSVADLLTIPAGLTAVTAIAAGAYHNLALKANGTVIAWGWNEAGQATVPPILANVSHVVAGYEFSVALKSDGTVTAWGDNSKGQNIPPPGLSQIAAIAAGGKHALALRSSLLPAAVARLDQPSFFTENVGIRRSAAVNALEVEGNASKTTAGTWYSNSDRRIKEDIRPVTQALDTLDKVRLVDFRYTPDYRAAHPGLDAKRYLNVIAQEFAEVFPNHVHASGEKLPDGSEILQVDTYPLTIYSAAAVQELHRENQEIKARLAAQDERLRRLEAAVGSK